MRNEYVLLVGAAEGEIVVDQSLGHICESDQSAAISEHNPLPKGEMKTPKEEQTRLFHASRLPGYVLRPVFGLAWGCFEYFKENHPEMYSEKALVQKSEKTEKSRKKEGGKKGSRKKKNTNTTTTTAAAEQEEKENFLSKLHKNQHLLMELLEICEDTTDGIEERGGEEEEEEEEKGEEEEEKKGDPIPSFPSQKNSRKWIEIVQGEMKAFKANLSASGLDRNGFRDTAFIDLLEGCYWSRYLNSETSFLQLGNPFRLKSEHWTIVFSNFRLLCV